MSDTPENERILARHSRKSTRREWWSGGTWLYPGDEIVERTRANGLQVDSISFDEQKAAPQAPTGTAQESPAPSEHVADTPVGAAQANIHQVLPLPQQPPTVTTSTHAAPIQPAMPEEPEDINVSVKYLTYARAIRAALKAMRVEKDEWIDASEKLAIRAHEAEQRAERAEADRATLAAAVADAYELGELNWNELHAAAVALAGRVEP